MDLNVKANIGKGYLHWAYRGVCLLIFLAFVFQAQAQEQADSLELDDSFVELEEDSVLLDGDTVVFEVEEIEEEEEESLVSSWINPFRDSIRYTTDFIIDTDEDLIADRIRCMETDMPLTYNDRVKPFVDYFVIRERAYTKEMIRRSSLYFPLFESILAEHGLPKDLKYLSIVESGLNPHAVSRAGAVGLWQFMPSTGRMFGMNQDFYIDERMDLYKSTVAASKYLKQLYTMFGDWELALAAYNSGPGNVRKAIRRSGYKRTFWEIYPWLPRETRSYVPQFIAVTYAMHYAEEHNLWVQDYKYLPEPDTLWVSGYLSLPTFAEQSGFCLDEFRLLNPELKRNALPENTKNYPLKVPGQVLDMDETLLASILDSASKEGKKELEYLSRNQPGSTYGKEKTVYRVQSGDVLGKIAERYSVRVSDIRIWNNIPGNLIKVGQRLDIWVDPGFSKIAGSSPIPSAPTKPQATVSPQAQMQKASDGSKFHMVQPGDTLWDISRLYPEVSVEKIKRLNNLKNNKIKPGQKLIIG